MENIFTNIYETKLWGNNNNTNYSGGSGWGSDVSYNEYAYIPFLRNFINNKNINKIVDLGCGDFRCGPLIYNDLNILYTGYDTYKKLVDYNSNEYLPPKYTFIHLDFFNNKENIVNGDLCILKDVLQHWSVENIYIFLDYLVENKKFKYILISNHSGQTENNLNIIDGDFRPLNCELLPLKKYNCLKLYNYNYNEVSLIEV
jgi:hypothetical protein